MSFTDQTKKKRKNYFPVIVWLKFQNKSEVKAHELKNQSTVSNAGSIHIQTGDTHKKHSSLS